MSFYPFFGISVLRENQATTASALARNLTDVLQKGCKKQLIFNGKLCNCRKEGKRRVKRVKTHSTPGS